MESKQAATNEIAPASAGARLLAGALIAVLVSSLLLVGNQPAVDRTLDASAQLAGLSRLRLYVLTAAALGAVLDGTVAAICVLLGWASFRSLSFPPPGYGMPWRMKRRTGPSARYVGAVLLFVGLNSLARLWLQIENFRVAWAL